MEILLDYETVKLKIGLRLPHGKYVPVIDVSEGSEVTCKQTLYSLPQGRSVN